MQDTYTYPALFCYDDDGVPGIGVVFPDLPGCVSQGSDEADAMRKAKEALSLHLFGMEEDGREIPSPTPLRELKPEPDQTPVLIDVWMPAFRERMNTKAINRMVTLPQWLDLRAKAAKINYSHVLQDGLKRLLGVEQTASAR